MLVINCKYDENGAKQLFTFKNQKPFKLYARRDGTKSVKKKMCKYKARTELAGVKICVYAQNYMQTSFFAYKYAICMTQIRVCPNAGINSKAITDTSCTDLIKLTSFFNLQPSLMEV